MKPALFLSLLAIKTFLLFTVIIFSRINFLLANQLEQKLTIDYAIENSLKNYPKILEYYHKNNSSISNLAASYGVFDVKLKQEYQDKSRGYYDAKLLDILLEKQNQILNSNFYAGYRYSTKDFGDYESYKNTGRGGEFAFGGRISLLQNRNIDKNRLNVNLAKLEVEFSNLQLQNIILQIKRDVKKAYFDWVFSFYTYQQYQELYNLALKRQVAFETRYKKGDIAKITLSENNKLLLQRKTDLQIAKIDFDNNSLYLGLFVRNSNYEMMQIDQKNVDEGQMKKLFNNLNTLTPQKMQADIDQAIACRIEAKLTKTLQNQELENLKYYQQTLLPKLDFSFEASKDIKERNQTRKNSENNLKLNFELPLQRTEAKNKIIAINEKIKAYNEEINLISNKITTQMKQNFLNLQNLQAIFGNISQEIDLAKQLENAEKEKFNQGVSSLFLVNQREQDVIKAKINQIYLVKNFYKIFADYEMMMCK